jgi:hypothetical protein
MFKRASRWILLFFVASGLGLNADGFQFENGRLKDEQVLELPLSAAQTKLVATKFKPGMTIRLTKAQQALIRAVTHAKEVPTKLELWRPSDLQGECSCFDWNIGLVFKPGWLELPLSRIVSDTEAIGRRPDPNG